MKNLDDLKINVNYFCRDYPKEQVTSQKVEEQGHEPP